MSAQRGDGSGPVQQTVRARLFELVDEEGKVRAELGVEPDGFPSFNLLDKNGVGRVGLTLMGGSPSLLLMDEDGALRALVRVGPEGASSVTLMGKDQKPHAMVSTEPDGSSYLAFTDADGVRRAGLAALADGASALTFSDQAGNVVWRAP